MSSLTDPRATEYATLIDEVARLMTAHLDEARLPLHVLLSSPFGSLNENQEELLAAAQSALDAADQEVRQLRTLLAIDRGEHPPTPQRIGLCELLRPVLAVGEAHAVRAHVTLHATISDTAHRVLADPLQLDAALTTFITYAIAHTPPHGTVTVIAEDEVPNGDPNRDPNRVRITITHAAPDTPRSALPLDVRLARRLIFLQQGTLPKSQGDIVINLPNEHSANIFAE